MPLEKVVCRSSAGDFQYALLRHDRTALKKGVVPVKCEDKLHAPVLSLCGLRGKYKNEALVLFHQKAQRLRMGLSR